MRVIFSILLVVFVLVLVFWKSVKKDGTVSSSGSSKPRYSSTQGTKEIRGTLVKAYDGDSFKMKSNGKIYEIRLFGIDAPEYKQPYNKSARKKLVSLIGDGKIKVKVITKDKYKRIVGKAYCQDKYVNLEMIKSGLAWHYKYYSKDQDLAEAETEARRKKLGMWKSSKNIPPWKFRVSKH